MVQTINVNLSALQLAAKGGMLVKLHVNIGCDSAIDIPVKNLLVVNSNKEKLSNTASYTILRHCALSALFKYAPNGEVPEYAKNNFKTQFTFYDSSIKNGTNSIANDEELTKVLEAAAMQHLMDDNENVILRIHCTIINQFRCKEAEKIRQEATAAAENVVKTLKEWMKKASRFVSDHAAKMTHEDFVVVSDKPEQKGENHHDNPIDWASRFVQVLLLPEKEQLNLASTSTKKSTLKKEEELLNQYDEAIDAIAGSVIKGFHIFSTFIVKAIEEHQDAKRCDILSLSSSPSLAESASISSSSSKVSCTMSDDVVEEQGVEIVFDSTGKKDAPEEWKIFFGEPAKEEEEPVLITNPCNAGVISVSSCDESSSFEEVDHSDEVSWAMLSDDE